MGCCSPQQSCEAGVDESPMRSKFAESAVRSLSFSHAPDLIDEQRMRVQAGANKFLNNYIRYQFICILVRKRTARPRGARGRRGIGAHTASYTPLYHTHAPSSRRAYLPFQMLFMTGQRRNVYVRRQARWAVMRRRWAPQQCCTRCFTHPFISHTCPSMLRAEE